MKFDYSNRVLKPGYTSCMGCGEALAMRLERAAALRDREEAAPELAGTLF